MIRPDAPGALGRRGPGVGVCGPALLLLVLSLLSLPQPRLATGNTCQATDLVAVQTSCRQENIDFIDAEKNDDHELICKTLRGLWFCVAKEVPGCFHNFTAIYQSFLHSPHNCQLTPADVQELQNLVNSGGVKEDVKVDVVPLTSSTPDYVTKTDDDSNDVTQSKDTHVVDSSKHQGNSAGQVTGRGASLWLSLLTMATLWWQAQC